MKRPHGCDTLLNLHELFPLCQNENKTKGTLVHERERITLLSKGTPSLGTPCHGAPALDIPNYPRTWMSSTED